MAEPTRPRDGSDRFGFGVLQWAGRMPSVSIGPLRAQVVRKPSDSAKTTASPLTIVLMHGFGAPGDDLVGLADAIDAPPGSTLIFPEAIHALSDLVRGEFFGEGRAWWLVDFARRERLLRAGDVASITGDIPPGLAEARAAVEAMLADLPSLVGDDYAARAPLVLGGFSQGAMLTLDVALRSAIPLRGAVLLSGTLIAEGEWRPRFATRAKLPVFQSHGTQDPILPFAIAEILRDALSEGGLDVTFDPFVGPHAIPPKVIRSLNAWIAKLGTADV